MIRQADDREKRSWKSEELVIINYQGGGYEFNNRWLSTDSLVVDYGSIERWNEDRLQMDNSNLRRIKIYGLQRESISDLLNRLSGSGRLYQLEIDVLRLLEGCRTEYTFEALRVFAVDAVRVVDLQGQPAVEREMPPPLPTIKLNARQLKTVHLGK